MILKKYIQIIINEVLKLHETLLEKANENINTERLLAILNGSITS